MGAHSSGAVGDSGPDPELERVYRDAVYAIWLGGREVTFRVGESIDGVTDPFVLVTAYNPGHERPPAEANAAHNAELRQVIEARGWRWVPAEGRSADGTHREPSFAVFGIAREEGIDLGRRFGQAAICWFDGATVRLEWC